MPIPVTLFNRKHINYMKTHFSNPCHGYVMFMMATFILKRYHVRLTPLPCYYSAPHIKHFRHLHDLPPS